MPFIAAGLSVPSKRNHPRESQRTEPLRISLPARHCHRSLMPCVAAAFGEMAACEAVVVNSKLLNFNRKKNC